MKTLLLNEFERFVINNYGDTSYAHRLKFYLAKLKFYRELDKTSLFKFMKRLLIKINDSISDW